MEIIMKPFIMIYHMVSKILSIPSKIFEYIIEKIEDLRLKRNKLKDTVNVPDNNKNKEQELIDSNNFSDVGTKKKEIKPLKRYRYIIRDSHNKRITGVFDAESENDVQAFLDNEDCTVEKIYLKKPYDIELGGNGKIKASALAFSLTQLSTYIKAGIPLVDSVRILAKQTSNRNEKKAYNRLVYDLLKGENFSDALEKQPKKFPKLLVNMVRTAEMTGDLPTVLDDMADYYTSIDQTRRQMISALTYPAIVLLMAFGVLIFMLVYLVPQFTELFESQGASLPALTLFIIDASDFVKQHYIIMIIGILVFVIIFYYLYKNVVSFRTAIQTFLMHIPVIGNIIIYNEVATFTKTFASLLNHGVFITDSMEVLSKITNNEVYKDIINNCLNNLAKGDSISASFQGKWAVPVVAYEMIVTGERTGQLGLMMEKVSDHFQMLHKTLIDQMKSLVEPILICFLALIVGTILLSIVQPMFSIYGQIK